jgi:hypothetical protein
MSNKITTSDYKKILLFYDLALPQKKKDLKTTAENILSSKLCRCIKKINKTYKNEAKSIGICTQKVINNKGFTRGKFKCKNGSQITLKKSNLKNKTMRKK